MCEEFQESGSRRRHRDRETWPLIVGAGGLLRSCYRIVSVTLNIRGGKPRMAVMASAFDTIVKIQNRNVNEMNGCGAIKILIGSMQ